MTSNIGGTRDFISDGHNGFAFKPRDINNLARKIPAILKDSGMYNRLCENLKRTVSDLPIFKRNIDDVYKAILNEHII